MCANYSLVPKIPLPVCVLLTSFDILLVLFLFNDVGSHLSPVTLASTADTLTITSILRES